MKSVRMIACASVVGLMLGALPRLAVADPVEKPAVDTGNHCFFVTEWRGWKSPDPDTLYLAVGLHDVYEVKLSSGAPRLRWADMHLVSIVRGGDTICSALDLDLKVADYNGVLEPLFPQSIRKMTPEEVAAIPPKFRP